MFSETFFEIVESFETDVEYDSDDGLLPLSCDILNGSEDYFNALLTTYSDDTQVDTTLIVSGSQPLNCILSDVPAAIPVLSSKEDETLAECTSEPIGHTIEEVLDLPIISRIEPVLLFVEAEENLSTNASGNQVDGLLTKKRKMQYERTTIEAATEIMTRSGLSHDEVNEYMTFYYEFHSVDNDIENKSEVLNRAFSCGIKLTEKANLRIFNIGSQRYRKIISNISSEIGKKPRKNHHFEHGVKKQLGPECHNSFTSFMLQWRLRDDNYFADEKIVSIQYLFNLYLDYCSHHKKNNCIISYSSFIRLRKKYFPDAIFHGRINCCQRQKSLRPS